MGKPSRLSPEEIRAGLTSADERTRANAARSTCACHGDWDLYRELLPTLHDFALHDPSPRVRGEAIHSMSDPMVVNLHEDARYKQDERREQAAQRRKERASRPSRQRRR